MKGNKTYRQIQASEKLTHLVHSFWEGKNANDYSQKITIVPDRYFKIIFITTEDKIVRYYMTGICIREIDVILPANSISYGCRLKILAPEYLLCEEIASLLQDIQQLDLSFLNLKYFDLSSFETIVEQWEKELLNIKSPKAISANKLRLTQLLDKTQGNITAKEVSEQIFWTNRQINRYLNKYIGISLKRYLNILKVYQTYPTIRAGKFTAGEEYFDQAHFIREVKKHTGETPKGLYEQQNDRFIQLKNIKPE